MDKIRTDQLLSGLAQYTSTTQYFRMGPRQLITDGAKYLADYAKCYWLLDAAFSHLHEIGKADWFVLIKLQVQGTKATIYYEDGNGNNMLGRKFQIPTSPWPSRPYIPAGMVNIGSDTA